MSTYAFINSESIVKNIVVAESLEDAQSIVTDNLSVIEITEDTKNAYIGGDMIDGKFRPSIPGPSERYTWNAESFGWQYVPTEEETAP